MATELSQTNKIHLLSAVQVAHRQLERYLYYFIRLGAEYVASGCPKYSDEELRQRDAVGSWSVQDVIANLTAWEQYLICWYESHAEAIDLQEPPSSPEQDPGRQSGQQSVLETLQLFAVSHQQLLHLLRLVPADELFCIKYTGHTQKTRLLDCITAATITRYTWAKQHIRRWRKTHAGKYFNKAALLKAIETERRRLEHNLAEMSEAAMIQPGVVGEWSVKDILAHLFDWEQRLLHWYKAGLDGEMAKIPAPHLDWDQLDVLNQEIFEAHRARPLHEILTEFRSSYQQLLTTVKAIPEADIFQVGRYPWLGTGNLAGFITANSSNHYRWAKTQIRRWERTEAA